MILIDFIKEHENWRELLANKPYCVAIKEKNDYALFKYTMGESDMDNELVNICRGIIVDLRSMKVVCRPFDKFYNWGEPQAANLSGKIRAEEKIDGSLMKIWLDRDGRTWNLSSNGTIDANDAELSIPVGDIKNYAGLFDVAWRRAKVWFDDLDNYPNWTFMFELVSPYARIVVPYKETEIYFLGMRNNETGEEISSQDCKEWAVSHGIKVPNVYPINTLNEAITVAKTLSKDHEGFVLVDENFNRIKVKGTEYLQLHTLRGSAVSERNVLTIILKGEQDDLVGNFPEYEEIVKNLSDKLKSLKNEALREIKEANFNQDRKEFAMQVKTWKFSGLLFKMYQGASKESLLEQTFCVDNLERLYKMIKESEE